MAHISSTHVLLTKNESCGRTKLQWSQEDTSSVEMPFSYANILLTDFYTFVLKLCKAYCKVYV